MDYTPFLLEFIKSIWIWNFVSTSQVEKMVPKPYEEDFTMHDAA